jgi:hypothetical protein
VKLAAVMGRQYLVLTVFHLFLVHVLLVKFGTNLVNRMKNNRKFKFKNASFQGALYGYNHMLVVKG